jgi:hypothetical protein
MSWKVTRYEFMVCLMKLRCVNHHDVTNGWGFTIILEVTFRTSRVTNSLLQYNNNQCRWGFTIVQKPNSVPTCVSHYILSFLYTYIK